MDVFLKFNRNSIEDRQIDTLIGLCKGITANGIVDQLEAEFLQTWLVQNRLSENPIIHNLLGKISEMLEDGVLDSDEAAELLAILRSLSGEQSELGELSKTASLPLCSPKPEITFENKTFLFTGNCAFGSRKKCQSAITQLGGINANSVTKKLDYLILGTYVTDSWSHETFGRKIEKAIEYRDSGLPLSIINEEHWLDSSGLLNTD